MLLDRLSHPIVQAPMAGGPSTPALAAAVSEAGGLGFLASGYRLASALEEDIAAVRTATDGPFGVNVFVPPSTPTSPAVYEPYVERLAADADRYGVALGQPRSDTDDWEAKLELLHRRPVDAVSFTFGCPTPDVIADLRERGTEVWVTVTEAGEARVAVESGAEVLVAQGVEAGGHRGSFADEDEAGLVGLLALLQRLAAATELPLVGAGGVATGGAVAAVLCAGARAAQVGTAFMLAPEAGTTDGHRSALAAPGATRLTRAFSGRRARGLENPFLLEHSPHAPAAYPEIHHVTAPLRAAARRAGATDVVNLWAGQAHELAQPLPAGEIVRSLAQEARAALDAAGRRLAG
jgi:nitronate monooxygenase